MNKITILRFWSITKVTKEMMFSHCSIRLQMMLILPTYMKKESSMWLWYRRREQIGTLVLIFTAKTILWLKWSTKKISNTLRKFWWECSKDSRIYPGINSFILKEINRIKIPYNSLKVVSNGRESSRSCSCCLQLWSNCGSWKGSSRILIILTNLSKCNDSL